MKNNKGFTLIETIIAMALIMIAVFVFTPIFAMSFKQISDAGNWQNIIISQRSSVEKQLAGRSAIFANTEQPLIDFNMNFEDNITSVNIKGKIISDTLGNRSYIRSFISNIYEDESLTGSVIGGDNTKGKEIIATPKTIYYGEKLFGKTFTIYGINITFTTDSISNIKISDNNNQDITSKFVISFNGSSNTITITVNNTAPDKFYLSAPFSIVYKNYPPCNITALLPQIIAVTDKGEFITGYEENEKIIYTKGGSIIPSSTKSVNDIIYNFQNQEYVAVGDSNLFCTFKESTSSLAWTNNPTTALSPANNNYSVSVDWLKNYMIGSSYNTINPATNADDKVEVFLSVKDGNYAYKEIFKATIKNNNGADTVKSIVATWFDLLRSTIFINIYNNAGEYTSGCQNDYILAIGNYVVTTTRSTTYYDLLYATKSYVNGTDAQWIDLSLEYGTPTNTPTSTMLAAKTTGVASGVGTSIQKDGTSADFSILLACTASGKIYGVSPNSTTDPMIVAGNTKWQSIKSDLSGTSLNSIVYGKGKFVAVGSGTKNVVVGTVNPNMSDTSTIDFSINKMSWADTNVDGVTFQKVRFINQKFYAVGKKSGEGVIYSSSDGLHWYEEIYYSDNRITGTITSIAGQ